MKLLLFAAAILLFALAMLAASIIFFVLSVASRNEAVTDQIHINNQILVNRYNSQLAAAQEAERIRQARESKHKKTDKDNLFKFNPRKDDEDKS